ncbi:MAG: oxaloacetate decarboxylase gamma subunit [Cognaticolwellia sp.]|jgi:oxaloacetate decarboxylase gamma subunit|tara:strand:+ start:133 stop:402 length:270 start_codon:yes stop_codon:yes gene_type:complete
MTPELYDAFGMLLVGMITVFTVLALVVVTGRTLIWVVNRSTKELPIVKRKERKSTFQEEISTQKMAAIVAAVEIITNGKGKVTSIEKAN